MKKILVITLAAALLLATVVSGSVAYFTDSVATGQNVITAGSIDVTLHEQARGENGLVDYQQKDGIGPYVEAAMTAEMDFSGEKINLRPVSPNYVDKIVTVENVGTNPAHLRVFLAVPTADYASTGREDNWLRWDAYASDKSWKWTAGAESTTENVLRNVTINDKAYDIYVATHADALPAGETSLPSLLGLYLDSDVDFNGSNYSYKDAKGETHILGTDAKLEILVAVEAAQTTTFANAWDALDASFGKVADGHHPWKK